MIAVVVLVVYPGARVRKHQAMNHQKATHQTVIHQATNHQTITHHMMETAKTHKKVMEKSVRRAALILAKAVVCIKEINRIF